MRDTLEETMKGREEMESWEDNNLLREIDDSDERRFAKEALLNGLGKAIQAMERRYEKLEERVYKEYEIPESAYGIVSTVIEREDYDPTNPTLFPVCPEDMAEGFLQEKYAEKGRNYIGTVYLEADLETCRSFEQRKRVNLQGRSLHIEKARRYREAVENLYQVFQDNQVPWRTVNTAYFDHFFDVFAEEDSLGSGNMENRQTEEMEFEEFGEKIRKGYILLWNIQLICFSSKDFRMPCISDIYYEHEFSIREEEKENGYLIQFNQDILEVRYEKNGEEGEERKIIIKSLKENDKDWVAYCIRQDETVRSLNYRFPILENKKKDTFLRRYAASAHVNLLTKADLFRRITELDIEDYIEAADYEIAVNGWEYPVLEGMNWFIKDEIFPVDTRKVLLLKFREKSPGNYLNDSMIKYAVSYLQTQLNEYRCVGVVL